MNVISGLYKKMHAAFCRFDERGEYSAGYFQDKVRVITGAMCKDCAGRLLDAGCGEGLLLRRLMHNNPAIRAWGGDLDGDRVLRAKELRLKYNQLKLFGFDICSLPFKSDSFDSIVCINVFFNMPSLDIIAAALEEMKRVCKKGGRIIFDYRNARNPLLVLKYKFARYYDPTVRKLPLQVYTPKEIHTLLKTRNLRISRRSYISFPPAFFPAVTVVEVRKE